MNTERPWATSHQKELILKTHCFEFCFSQSYTDFAIFVLNWLLTDTMKPWDGLFISQLHWFFETKSQRYSDFWFKNEWFVLKQISYDEEFMTTGGGLNSKSQTI